MQWSVKMSYNNQTYTSNLYREGDPVYGYETHDINFAHKVSNYLIECHPLFKIWVEEAPIH